MISEDQMVYAFSDESTRPAVQAALDEEMAFRETYYATNGFHWSGTVYPRPPPTLPIIKATHIGQKIVVPISDPKARQYLCSVPAPQNNLDEFDDESNQVYVHQCLRDGRQPDTTETSRTSGSLTLEVISLEPRVFYVQNFLSDFEADYIITQARPKLAASTVGHGINAQVDTTRTSKSAWVTRTHSEIMEAIYRRVALVTAIPQEILTENSNVESLNVLHYPKGGEYTPHYDWGPNGKIASRFLSGLMYLNTPLQGGGTSFPKSKTPNAYVPATKGSYAFFYDLLEDGNGDVLSLHAGTVVEKGHKWIAPLWIWDPTMNGQPHQFGDVSDAKLQTITPKSEL
eukprot:TRINITY_DN13023_c0_g1_i5.p1 TRINITY_DN13023_c0_g1~~TRINITY_DN13023_c0_g1_i5.p1  ORF type:complete len:343 (+),score=51.12 TRINITY_DN13023_c0_g1_i5:152-1180(+)